MRVGCCGALWLQLLGRLKPNVAGSSHMGHASLQLFLYGIYPFSGFTIHNPWNNVVFLVEVQKEWRIIHS